MTRSSILRIQIARASVAFAAFLVSIFLLTPAAGAQQRVITVGSKAFTESVVLAQVAEQTLQAADIEADTRDELGGTRFVWNALLSGQVDVYPEYTGTLVLEILGGGADSVDGTESIGGAEGAGAASAADETDAATAADETDAASEAGEADLSSGANGAGEAGLSSGAEGAGEAGNPSGAQVADGARGDHEHLRRTLAELGIGMTEPLGFNNTYALGMREDHAVRLNLGTISDLREHPDLTLAFSNEFMDREDGWPGLRRAYALPHAQVRGLDHDLAYRGLAAGSIDVTDLYSTDAEIAYYDLRVLEDDRSYFPKYEAVYLYRLDLPQTAIAALERLAGTIGEEEMIHMNAQAKIERIPENRIAAEFLQSALGIQRVGSDAPAGRLHRIWRHTKEHLWLVGVSLLAAILLSIPLGIAAARYDRAGQVILGIVGVIYTIPALALLVFMIPLLGIGGPPAMVALFLYSLLPIVRNTHAGLKNIAPELIESADALGLTPQARLRKIELPLASRTILAGIKTSAVINIGTATLGALIGAGGYGQPILTGIRLDDVGLILEGAVPAALLALAAQGLFEIAERFVVPRGLRLTAA